MFSGHRPLISYVWRQSFSSTAKATRVIAIGIGPEANVIELRSIATTAGDVVLLDSMDFLAGELDNVIGMVIEYSIIWRNAWFGAGLKSWAWFVR